MGEVRVGRAAAQLFALGHRERLDHAGELAELGGDAVAAGLELGDLGTGALEGLAGALAELLGLGTALGDEGEGLLAGPAAVLGGARPGWG